MLSIHTPRSPEAVPPYPWHIPNRPADEASAALDSETSFHIMNEILQMKVLTRIVVFHSMNQSLLKQYDQIIIMKNGKVQEVGRFEELMERKGYFYSLYCIEKGL